LSEFTENSLVVISGILGKRTRFQQKDVSQLVLQVTASDSDAMAEERAPVQVDQDLLPKV